MSRATIRRQFVARGAVGGSAIPTTRMRGGIHVRCRSGEEGGGRRTPSPNSVFSEHQVAAVRFTNPLWHVEFSHMVGLRHGANINAGHLFTQLCQMTRNSEFVPAAVELFRSLYNARKRFGPLVEGRTDLNLNIPCVAGLLLTTLIAQVPAKQAVLRRKLRPQTRAS